MMSATFVKLPHRSEDARHDYFQTSPLLGCNSSAPNNASASGSQALSDRPFHAEGQSAALSVQLNSSATSPLPPESHSYSEVTSPGMNRTKPRDPDATERKMSYQNEASPLSSAPTKIRPVPRPPPRSASESEEDKTSKQRPPPRTYLNNDSVARPVTPSSRTPNVVPDRSNEITNILSKPVTDIARPGRQSKLCVIMAFVAIFLALSMAAIAAGFAIPAYLRTTDSEQVQGNSFEGFQNYTTASAHVRLEVRNFTRNQISDKANVALYVIADKSKLHKVDSWPRGLVIRTKGRYFVYSSVNYNINEHNVPCDKVAYKTWIQLVVLIREDHETPLLRSEHTCCNTCTEDHSSTFTGGVFELHPEDKICVRVSAPKFVFGDKESNFLGLFLLK